MASNLTPTAARTTVSVPSGSDRPNVADLTTFAQALLNRSEWNAKSLIDVKSAMTTAIDNDFSSTTFANATQIGSLTFTDVSIGDVIILDAALSLYVQTFTADGTDPGAEARFLVGGATDATVGGGGAYPRVRWGSTVPASAEDERTLSFRSIYTAASATSSLSVALQYRASNASHPVFNPFAQILGVHFRLGAA